MCRTYLFPVALQFINFHLLTALIFKLTLSTLALLEAIVEPRLFWVAGSRPHLTRNDVTGHNVTENVFFYRNLGILMVRSEKTSYEIK